MADDRQVQEEEALALQAIYDQDFQIDKATTTTYHFTLRLDANADDSLRSPRLIVVDFHVPESYPSSTMPIYDITSVYCGTRKIEPHVRKEMDDHLQTMFVPGEVVLFEWIDWLKEFLEAAYPKEEGEADQNINETVDEERPEVTQEEEEEEEDDGVPCPDIQSGEALVDRKSVFVAHVARVNSVDEVQAVRRKLLQNKKIAKATHNILAYRIQLDSGVVAQDHDEDGETAAGGKYERQREKYNHSYVRATLNTDFQI
jgi:hypothetical protein